MCLNAVNDYSYKKLKKQLSKYNPIMISTGCAVYVLAGKMGIKTVDQNKRISKITAKIPFDTYDNNPQFTDKKQ